MALKLNSSLSLLPSTLSPNLSSNSSSSPFLFSPTHFQSKTKIIPFLQNHCPMKSAALSTLAAQVGVGEDLPFDYGDIFPKADPSERRRAGVLLHPTSFRGPHGIGDLGEEAFRFIDWLHEAGCSLWQVLPLVPPGRKANEEGSPYSGQDANCGNTLLISVEELVKDGLLTKEELPKPVDSERVNYSTVADIKDPLITKAAERLIRSEGELKSQLEAFRTDPDISSWLEDAAYFAAIDSSFTAFSWYEWPEPLKNCHLAALEEIYQSKQHFISIFIAEQFLFQRQWQKVRKYAQMKGISIMGDMPIYVGYHSADVWANRKHFLLNRSGFPLQVSGVHPDAFSETGQLWNSPLYDWKSMEKEGFSWWMRRIRRAQNIYDEFRIDHFRGLAGFWAVPSEAKVATVGRWKAGPGKSFFDALNRAVGRMNIIAEDLGVITEDVIQLRKSIGAPGMAVLQFGFGSDGANPHLPHNHEPNQVVYTGTHDNDTIRGWWDVLKQEEKSNVLKYLSITEEDDIPWELTKAALSSVARTAIIPMQDILRLGNSVRMNIPATQGDKAMAIYKTITTPKNKASKLHHAWNILKDCPRWGTDANQQCGRLFHSEAPPPNDVNEGVNFADNEGVKQMNPTYSFARPLARDKQREAKRKGKSQDPIRAQFASEMARLNENQCRRQEESAQMRLAMKEEGDREQERFEINLMMEDLDKYIPERKKYLRGKQKDILRRNATKSIFQDDDSSQDYHPSPSPSQDGGYHY